MSLDPGAAPSGPAAAETAPAAPAPPPRLSVLLTIALSLVVVMYVVGWPVVIPLIEGRLMPLESLREPERALERLVEREMDLARALRDAPAWEWWLFTGGTTAADAGRDAREWYEELLDLEDSPWARLEHAVLVGEGGGPPAETMAQWAGSEQRDERLEGWATAAYLGPPPDAAEARAMIGEIRDALGPGWFGDVLELRLAERIGDAGASRAAEAAIVHRGRDLAARLRVLIGCGIALLGMGAIALCLTPWRRPALPIGSAPVPARWPLADGWALFVRGLGAPQALTLAFFYVVRRETSLDPIVGMLADLTLFAWITVYVHARHQRVRDVFGLVPLPGSRGRLLRVSLGLIALTLAGDFLVDLVGPPLGLRAHWSDGFPEDLLWTTPGRVAFETFDAVVWAPIVEELTFRGLLYGTLRGRLGVLPSAVLSALVFVLPHDYGLSGSLSVFTSGVLWAIAYERTRSLLPGMIAHAANNAISTAWALATLRF